jgi:magnesium transporter
MAKTSKDELIRTLTYRPDERIKTLRSLSIPEQSAAFSALSPYVQQSVLKGLRTHEIVNILDHMDMQQTQRVLARVHSAKKREAIVHRLKGDVKEKMEYFLRFHPKATLSLINFNYLFLDADSTVGEAAELIEDYYEETDRYPEILVHSQGQLLGEVLFSSLVRERNSSTLRKFVHELPVITYQAEIKEVVELLTSSKSRKIIVLDHDTSVLGLIYADAVKTLFGDLPAESLYDFAGVDDSERPFDGVGKKVSNRYRWLILNLGTSFLAGFVVLAFQGTLDELVIMSIYIPIVAGMGGNAATQTFAVMVRGLTLGTISLQTATPAILKEGMAGVINGVIIGTIVALISWLWNGDPMFGLVAGIALIGVHIVAAFAGAIIPLLMKHLGKDPAATSTIFITTMTDVGGLFLLLGLATWVLL